MSTLPLIGGPLDGLEYYVYANDVELIFPIRRDEPVQVSGIGGPYWAHFDRAIYRVQNNELIFDRYEYPGT